MKKKRNLLVVLVVVLLLITSLSGFSRNYIFEASGSVIALDFTSTTFMVNFKFVNGLAQFNINGPNIQNKTTISSQGRVIGGFDITLAKFKQAVNLLDGGSLSSRATTLPDTLILLQFDGKGFSEITISTDDLLKGNTHLLALLDADYVWILVKDDKPEPIGPHPILRVVAVGSDGKHVRLVIKNFGSAPASGDTTLTTKLSYKAKYWIGDSDIVLFRLNFGRTRILPGDIGVYQFTIPDQLPSKPFELFLKRRGLFDSFDYPNPPQDCFDFCLSIGGKTIDAFSPVHINEH
ncbi:MAG: hypothetical protein U9N62_10390 [Thermotogota bacterium]|nr:hypothetical protein [Thermotogota bacterium]